MHKEAFNTHELDAVVAIQRELSGRTLPASHAMAKSPTFAVHEGKSESIVLALALCVANPTRSAHSSKSAHPKLDIDFFYVSDFRHVHVVRAAVQIRR